jgi:alcohol dehydrogenase class IV
MRRVLVVTGSGPTGRSEGLSRLKASLGEAGIHAEVYAEVGHDPDSDRVEDAARRIAEGGFDGVVAFGGGSPLDCAKAAALHARNGLSRDSEASGASFLDFVYGRAHFDRPGLPLVAIPTTAGSGSEMSANVVTTDLSARRKLGLSNPWFYPRLALVDPGLQATMPASLTAATGMDALTHALESYVSRRSTPLTRAIAGEAAGLILGSLGRACAEPPDMEARSAMALGSSIVAMAFSQTGLGMVHGFAHPVGARGGVAHGVANAVILPYIASACAEANPAPFATLAAAAHLPVAGL